MYENILVETQNGVCTITLNRPEVGNAFAKDSYREVREAILVAEQDKQARAVIIAGAGKHFSAGGDIKRFKNLIDSKTYLQMEGIENAGRMTIAVRKCIKPTIAMINGAAAGAGLSLALACDFRVVTRSSKLVMAFIKLGLSGDSCGMYFLQKLVGIGKMTEMMMLGNSVGGEEAHALGLANILAEEGCLESETLKLATTLASSPTRAFEKQKLLMGEFFYGDMENYMLQEGKFMAECSRSKDFEIAVNAFLEKQAPQFCGE